MPLAGRFSFLVLLGAASCAGGAPAPEQRFRERLLATVPAGARLDGLVAFAEDGGRAAYVEREDGLCRAVCDAWKSRPFNLVC